MSDGVHLPVAYSRPMEAIADLKSVFTDKFGIPRQSGQVPEARGEVILRPPYARAEAVRGLADCSHIWLLFECHRAEGWRPTVRPPRLGGNRRIGVFASRSPFRPNPIGLSVVRLDAVDVSDGVRLRVSGVDMLDGTPILDIKPYLTWADAIPEATGFAVEAPPSLPVRFADEALSIIEGLDNAGERRRLIESLLALDPRPAYHNDPGRTYASEADSLTVRWRVVDNVVEVLTVSVG